MSGWAAVLLTRAARARTAAHVTIDNFAFSPAALTIGAGDTVTWTNRDDIPHSIVCPALGLHSHVLDTDQSVAATFPSAGSYGYACGLHPHMIGTITVT